MKKPLLWRHEGISDKWTIIIELIWSLDYLMHYEQFAAIHCLKMHSLRNVQAPLCNCIWHVFLWYDNVFLTVNRRQAADRKISNASERERRWGGDTLRGKGSYQPYIHFHYHLSKVACSSDEMPLCSAAGEAHAHSHAHTRTHSHTYTHHQ